MKTKLPRSDMNNASKSSSPAIFSQGDLRPFSNREMFEKENTDVSKLLYVAPDSISEKERFWDPNTASVLLKGSKGSF